jgi:signal transduction histidine kinase
LVAIALHQHHLQQQTQRCNEQLRYLNYLKEDFLSTLNHELRTPLTSMMLAIRMLRRPDLTPERAAMYLDILEQQCSRETNLVNDLLMLQTVDTDANRAQLMPVDLVQVLTTLAQEAQESLAAVQLSLVVHVPQDPVRVLASASHLTRTMQELLTNARKYSAPGSTITLTLVKPTDADAQATVQISNVGAGIQADELPHIFEKFRRGRNATKDAIPGTGTGLALVRGLMEQIDGTITATSHPLGEQLWQTCFSLGFRRHRPAA